MWAKFTRKLTNILAASFKNAIVVFHRRLFNVLVTSLFRVRLVRILLIKSINIVFKIIIF